MRFGQGWPAALLKSEFIFGSDTMLMEMLNGQRAMTEAEHLRDDNRRLWRELNEARQRIASLEAQLESAKINADVWAERLKRREGGAS